MNLSYLISKGAHKRISTSDGVVPGYAVMDERRWHGVTLPPGGGQISILRATECQPFRSRPSSIGWCASAQQGASELEVFFVDSVTKAVVSPVQHVSLGEHGTLVSLPWGLEPTERHMDLVVRTAESATSPAFLGACFMIDRQALIRLCTGRGVELGPGPKPQILPAPDVDVMYVEQYGPDDWQRLYGADYKEAFKPHLLPFYHIGDAHEIPVEAGSLDFIFSSHVFEHLANPLGHLALWRGLLKDGGRIAMVIPDYIGSKDFLMDETSLDVLEREYDQGAYEVNLDHYKRFDKSRGGNANAQELYDKRWSIHVHFYTQSNMARICAWAVERLGYRAWSIVHSPNHKDFHVVLTR